MGIVAFDQIDLPVACFVTVFMDGRDNGPAMTNLLWEEWGLRGQMSRQSPLLSDNAASQ